MRCALALLLGLAGCFGSNATTCADGTVCPAGKICAPAGNACIDEQQLTACEDVVEGGECMVTGGRGRCHGGLCMVESCGDGVVAAEEVCDDGNIDSGDGCRSDCRKVEMCGDALLDSGEGCDDGNANPADDCDACAPMEWKAEALLGAGVTATSVGMRHPWSLAHDAAGNLYIADRDNYRIRRIDAVTGDITTVAGNGIFGSVNNGDGGPATIATIGLVLGIAVDGLGNLYIASISHHCVRRVDGRGIITTVAGICNSSQSWGSFDGDGGPATLARLNQPSGVAVDGLGNLYIADSQNHRIRRVAVTGEIRTIAGTGVGGFNGDNLPLATQLYAPRSIALSGSYLYVADRDNHRVRRFLAADSSTAVTTVAGTGTGGFNGDGQAISSQLYYPEVVVAGPNNTVYVSDTDNHRVRRIASGMLVTLAGVSGGPGFGGDGGLAINARLNFPRGLALAADGTLNVADTYNERVRAISTSGTITTVVGDGSLGFAPDGALATSIGVSFPSTAIVDTAGRVFFSDTGNHRIRRIEADGSAHTVAGTGAPGFSGDGGPATAAAIQSPRGLAFDSAGALLFADDGNNRIRRIDTNGTITTVAGNGSFGFSGDNGPATSASLDGPNDVAVVGTTIYIADTDNNRIRMVAGGTITTIAGIGTSGAAGDNGPATSAQLSVPRAMAFDGAGNMYIADTGNHRIRRIDTTGTITTLAGTTSGLSGDGAAATSAQLSAPCGVAVDGAGNVLIADTSNNRIRQVSGGTITTIVGSTQGFSGDGAPAASAQLQGPQSVKVTSTGVLLIGDTMNQSIRRVETAGRITTVAGPVDPDGMGRIAVAFLADPRMFVRTPDFTLVAGGSTGTVQALRSTTLETVAGRYKHLAPTGSLARFQSLNFASLEGIGGVAYDAATSRIFFSGDNTLHVVTVSNPADATTWSKAIFNSPTVPNDAGWRDGPIATALFRQPEGMYLDETEHALYIADTGNHAIRVIDLDTNIVDTIGGIAETRGFFGDGGPAESAALYGPRAITRCPNGDIFVADTGNHRVRRIDIAGTISTVLGDGIPASSGEGSPANTYPVDSPLGLACDAFGNVFVTSTSTVRLLAASDTGIVDGFGAVHTIFGGASGVSAEGVDARCLTGILAIDATTVQTVDCAGALIQVQRSARP